MNPGVRFIGAGEKTKLTIPLQDDSEILLVQGRLDAKCNEKVKKCLGDAQEWFELPHNPPGKPEFGWIYRKAPT